PLETLLEIICEMCEKYNISRSHDGKANDRVLVSTGSLHPSSRFSTSSASPRMPSSAWKKDDTLMEDPSNTYILSDDRPVATVLADNLIIVGPSDPALLARPDRAHDR